MGQNCNHSQSISSVPGPWWNPWSSDYFFLLFLSTISEAGCRGGCRGAPSFPSPLYWSLLFVFACKFCVLHPSVKPFLSYAPLLRKILDPPLHLQLVSNVQGAKKGVSHRPVLVDFPLWLLNSVLHLCDRQYKFLEEINFFRASESNLWSDGLKFTAAFL